MPKMPKLYRASKAVLICDILREAEENNLEDQISYSIAENFVNKAMFQLKTDYNVTFEQRLLILRKFKAYCEKTIEARKAYNKTLLNFL